MHAADADEYANSAAPDAWATPIPWTWYPRAVIDRLHNRPGGAIVALSSGTLQAELWVDDAQAAELTPGDVVSAMILGDGSVSIKVLEASPCSPS